MCFIYFHFKYIYIANVECISYNSFIRKYLYSIHIKKSPNIVLYFSFIRNTIYAYVNVSYNYLMYLIECTILTEMYILLSGLKLRKKLKLC